MNKTITPYFVLYLVALTGLLLVTDERDIAEAEGKQVISVLMEEILKAPVLTVPDVVRLPLMSEQPVLLSIAGLATYSEKKNVRYFVNAIDSVPPDWHLVRIERDSSGNGLMYLPIGQKSEYTFEAYCKVDREFPQKISGNLKRGLEKALAQELKDQESKRVRFVLKVGEEGEFLPLAFEVDRTFDKWITGRKYSKRIFVSNVDPFRVGVTLVSNPPRPFYLERTKNTIRLNWDNPDVGVTSVTVRGSANRGLGNDDVAETRFVIDVGPPRWQPDPKTTAYKNVNYRWESGLGGMNADEYVVQMHANDMLIETISPNQYPYEKKIDPSWSRVAFKAVAGNNILKQIDVQVKEPPPPEIRWGEVKRGDDDVRVEFFSEDIDGGPVAINMNVIQPSGVRALLEPQGKAKNFVITIKDTKNIRTPHVELRVQAIGIGGVSKTPARTITIRYN
ncbi:MAG: hypothetical protein KF749_09445 [Bacteroidetes bacterium]|nr:hypothetical protein [Bacteroidota bacterium]MCW5894849.1 hypothetical protein [Bacteroidota bacterium]